VDVDVVNSAKATPEIAIRCFIARSSFEIGSICTADSTLCASTRSRGDDTPTFVALSSADDAPKNVTVSAHWFVGR
jgi:hypothetical protein